MPVLKRSRQRDCIKEFLIGRCDHPTADIIYTHVKEQFPNISLGTVYRNLSLLSEIGEIQKISCNGPDRFDGNPLPHYHFTCDCCGSVYDLELKEKPCLCEFQPKNFHGIVNEVHLDFHGICEKCNHADTV